MDNGLNLFLPNEKKFVHYKASDNNYTLNHDEVETITEDKNGIIWVGTDNGLSKLINSKNPVPENKFQNLFHEDLDETSLLSNSVKILFVDSRNSIWAGTYFGGINVYNRSLFKFHPIRHKPWVSTSLSNNIVTAFAEDENGNLWIGTDGGGLNYFPNAFDNIFADHYEVIPIRNPVTGRIETKIKSIEIDQNGLLWIGIWGDGLYRLDPKSKKTKYFGPKDSPSSGFNSNNVLKIKVDPENNLWLGTFVRGITYFNQKENRFTTYLPDPSNPEAFYNERIHAIFIDNKERVWIGGNIGGLNLYKEADNTFETTVYKYVLTKSTSILCMAESKNGKIWIGTISSGAILFDPDTKTAESFSEEMGLSNNVVQSIIEDDSGRVWMSTNLGLNVFDPDAKTTMSYTKIDGLQGNQFNTGSSLKCSNGMLLFGGINGWNAFFPDSIPTNKNIPKIAFTNFWLKSKLMNVNIPGSPLKSDINQDDEVELHHNQNSFSVEFAALDYNFNNKSEYAYMLEGFNSDWQYIGRDRKVTFTNLKPKQYKLRVKATNQDGLWTEKKKPLIINILPAWWQTFWFKVIAGVLIVLLIYLFSQLRMKLLIRQSRRLENEVQIRTAQLKDKNLELYDKNNEILAQNEELSAQNDQIITQQEKLQSAKEELKRINQDLEKTVNKRTKKLKSTIKKLDKTVLELDRFVYSASHDLSAPLKSIRGLIQISKNEKDAGKVHECLEYMESSVIKLESVIQSLVEYSRNTHLDLKIESINLHEMVNDVINELAFWPEAVKINIINDIDNNFVVHSDKARLKIILHNMIGNGIKYADFKKDWFFVKIESNRDEMLWMMKISDNGIGIEENYIKNIFDMYFRASEKSQGSGLGLFIVKETVNKLKGSIQVMSEKNVGTSFILVFPEGIHY